MLTVSAKQAIAVGWQQDQARELVATAPANAWERHSCGAGSKGPRLHDWLRLPINHPYDAPWQRWLVVRRGLTHPDDPRSIAYFLVFAPAETSLATLAQVIGERWGWISIWISMRCVEVRSWHGWHWHITLAMWAHAFLAVTPASTHAPAPLVPPTDEGKKSSAAEQFRNRLNKGEARHVGLVRSVQMP